MDKWLPYEFQALKRVRGLGAGLYVQTKNVLCTFQALKRVRSLGAANAESAGHRHKLKFQALKREHGHLAGKISIRGLSPKHVSSPQAGTRPVSPNGEYSPIAHFMNGNVSSPQAGTRPVSPVGTENASITIIVSSPQAGTRPVSQKRWLPQ